MEKFHQKIGIKKKQIEISEIKKYMKLSIMGIFNIDQSQNKAGLKNEKKG